MTARLNTDARNTLRSAGVSQAAWIRHHFGDDAKKWYGDACGCPDDRCIGYHHDTQDDCQCLLVLLPEMASGGCFSMSGDSSKATRRVDGKPETDADKRFFQLRDSGYRGPIDHHGYAIPEGRDAEYLRSIKGGV